MSLLDNVAPAPRKVMTLFYVVDTSGSMCGSKIGSVNSAMEEAITSDCRRSAQQTMMLNQSGHHAVQQWLFVDHSAECPIAIGDVIWNDLNAGGVGPIWAQL